MSWKVITFYTPDYGDVVRNLKASLEALSIRYEAEVTEDKGSWVRNCAYKPFFIRKKLVASSEPVVWLDADSVVRREPARFYELARSPIVDFAAHFRTDKRYNNELLSGTLFFNKTEGARRILDAWCDLMEQKFLEWDQYVLQEALQKTDDVCIYRLNSVYTKIFDTMQGDPIIEHFQESRKKDKTKR